MSCLPIPLICLLPKWMEPERGETIMSTVGWIVVSILIVLFLILIYMFFVAVGKFSRWEEQQEMKQRMKEARKDSDSSWF